MADGRKFGKFLVDAEPVGQGAFGTVYRALDTNLEVTRALKFLHPTLISIPNVVHDFVREARRVARLAHPNIIAVQDVFEYEGAYAIVMSYAAGGSLAQRLAKDGAMTLAQTLAVLRQVVAGLHYAHKQGFIHCDIKPQNILFDGEGNALLSDFGLAKLQSEQVSNSADSNSHSAKQMRGTYAYIAPEIWEGQTPGISADSYALACTVYEMLTGKLLFQGSTPMSILKQHAKGPDLTAIKNVGVRAALTRALEADPKLRILPEQLLAAFEQASSKRIEANKQNKLFARLLKPKTLLISALGVVSFLIMGITINFDTRSTISAITETPTPNPTSTPTSTPNPTPTSTPNPTSTSTPNPTSTSTPKPTSTPTPIKPLRDIPIKINDRTNLKIEDILPNFVTGDSVRNGVRFNIPSGQNNRFATQCVNTPEIPSSITIANLDNNGIKHVEQVYILINAGWTMNEKNKTVIGYVTFSFSNGSRLDHALVLGENIREWLVGSSDPNIVKNFTSQKLSNIFSSQNSNGAAAVLDMLQIDIPATYRNETLSQISVIDASPGACLFFSGITVRARD